jgi:hypothetical protein
MRITTTQVALLALPALIHARTVSLMDFVPRVSDVSGQCEDVYKQSIPNCEPSDFTQKGCSVQCVKGLDSMTDLIKEACGNDGLLDRDDKSNVLAVFLKGNGPQGLCTNADEVLQSQHSSTATPTSLDAPTRQPTTTIVSSTKTASSTDVPTSLAVDTSSSPEPTESAFSTSSAGTSDTASITTVTESSQIFEAPSMPASWPSSSESSKPTESAGHSGGGSPFDAEGNEFSAAVATSSSTIALFLAVVFAGLAAHW